MSFERALKVEKVHQKMFMGALEKIQSGDLEQKEYFICPICGFPAEGGAPERCPVCGTPKEAFRIVS